MVVQQAVDFQYLLARYICAMRSPNAKQQQQQQQDKHCLWLHRGSRWWCKQPWTSSKP
jgi:hypothetical protein